MVDTSCPQTFSIAATLKYVFENIRVQKQNLGSYLIDAASSGETTLSRSDCYTVCVLGGEQTKYTIWSSNSSRRARWS